MQSTSRPQQSLFLEDWLRTAAADASQLQSPLPPPPPAAAILRSWAGLRDPSYDTPRILSALETLSRSRAALHVSDPQVKLLISLLSSPLLSAEAIPHLLCLLYVYLRKSPRPSTPIILSILSISSSFPPSPHSVLLLGALAASPALPDASRPSCLDRLCSLLDSSLPAILHDVSLLPEFLAGVGYALSRSEDNSYFGKILNFLFRVWDSRAGGIPPVLSHGLMLLYLFDWCASGFLASRSWNKIESLHHGISGDKCKSRGYSAPFVVLMTSAGILRAFNSNRVEIDPPLRKSIEVSIFYGAECAISMTESSSGTDGARDSHILLQCVALCLVRCGPISYYPPVLRCLCLALLNEIFPLQSVFAMSLENGKGNSITNTVKEHLGSAVFKEAGAVTRIFCNQYAAADEASKVMVENHLWDYSQELYSNVRIAAWVHRGKSNGILEDLEKIAEAAFLMVVVFAAEVTKKKLNKSSQEFKPEVSSRILVTFSCIEYLRRARLPEYTEAVRRAVLTIQEDAPSCALFIESMPPYAELTKAQGSIILERMRYIWSLDEVQTARVSFYLRVLPACISLIPTPVFRERVTPTMFLYLQHPNEKVTRASHSVFVSFVSSGNDSDLDDRLALKEQLVFYYMQRALEMYPDITSFEGLASGVAALVRHLPAGSPAIFYCIHSLVGKAADLCRKALSEDPTLWKNWEGNSGPPKKVLDLLLRLIYLVDIQVLLPYLLKQLAELIVQLPKDGQNALLDEMYPQVAESDDVTRKPVLVSWLQSLSYLCSQKMPPTMAGNTRKHETIARL